MKSTLLLRREKSKHSRSLLPLYPKWTSHLFVWHSKGITYWKNEQQYLLDNALGFLPMSDLLLELTVPDDPKDEGKQFCFRNSNQRLVVKAETGKICQEWMEAFERHRVLVERKSERHSSDLDITVQSETFEADTLFKDFFTLQRPVNPWDGSMSPAVARRLSVIEPPPRAPSSFEKGSLAQVIDYALSKGDTVHAILLLHHTLFVTSAQLFEAVTDRFYGNSDRGLRTRVVNFIGTWIKAFPEDLKGITSQVESFFIMRAKPIEGLPDESARAIRASIDLKAFDGKKANLKRMFEQTRPHISRRSPGPTLNFLKKFVPEPPDICDFPAAKIARELCRSDFDTFKRIQPRELVNKNWVRGKDLSPNVFRLISVFNQRTYWVASQIIVRPPKQQFRCIWHFVSVLEECRALNNFFAAYAILNGLSLTPIYRLQAAWNAVPTTCKQSFTRLKADLDSARNYTCYRTLFARAVGAKLPYLPVALKDLFQLEEIPTVENGVINWGKLVDSWEIMKKNFFEPQELGHWPDHWDTCPELQMCIHAGCVRVLTEEQIWERSYQCLPKGSKQ